MNSWWAHQNILPVECFLPWVFSSRILYFPFHNTALFSCTRYNLYPGILVAWKCKISHSEKYDLNYIFIWTLILDQTNNQFCLLTSSLGNSSNKTSGSIGNLMILYKQFLLNSQNKQWFMKQIAYFFLETLKNTRNIVHFRWNRLQQQRNVLFMHRMTAEGYVSK